MIRVYSNSYEVVSAQQVAEQILTHHRLGKAQEMEIRM